MAWTIECKTSKGWEFFTRNDDAADEGAAREEFARTRRADPANEYRLVDLPEDDGDEDVAEEDKRYEVVRFYQDDDLDSEVIETGLTLEQAQAHCEDEETSSRTATGAEAVARTEQYGAWFDGYREA